ncbi:hypothetical protein H4R35_001547 [Dimargaris xerosporica]|nr:hypothetical protein H4R35_001547 [Dimargaris xerosporica]
MIFRSPVPPVAIPRVDIPTFLFDEIATDPLWQNPQRSVFTDALSKESVSIEQLRTRAHQLASGWQNTAGLKRGQVVALVAPNDIHYSTLLLSVLLVGGTVTLVNPAYTAQEMAFQLTDSGAAFVVADHEMLALVQTAAAMAGVSKDRVYTLQPASQLQDGVPSVFTLASDRDYRRTQLTADEALSTTAFLCYSSGTTGRSKGVMTTHYNMIANVCQLVALKKHQQSLLRGATVGGVLPFYHIYGLNVLLHANILEGVSTIVFRKFDLEHFVQCVQHHRIAFAYLVPPIILGLARQSVVDKYDLSSLKGVISGAAPLSLPLAQELAQKFNIDVGQGFGMTELSPVAHMGHNTAIHGTNGVAVPNSESKILDENGQELGPGEVGELCVRGPNVMKGYLNNPEATKAMIDAEGFLHTGDVGFIDESGELTISDRIKELIKYKGFQVPPAELEALVITHPKVADVVVIGVYDDARATELPKAFVVPKTPPKDAVEEAQLAEDIVQFVEARVVNHKRLRGGVAFISAVPKSGAGKILRRQLRQTATQSAQPLKSKL